MNKFSFILLLLCASFQGLAQGENIQVRFLNAKFTDSGPRKDLVAVFLVSTADSSSFPPVVNLPPKCTVFEDGREKVVILTPQNLSVSFDDEQIAVKNPEVYALIKDKVDLRAMRTSMLVTYSLKDLEFEFSRMSMTPSFKEKRNQAVRVDKRFEFNID